MLTVIKNQNYIIVLFVALALVSFLFIKSTSYSKDNLQQFLKAKNFPVVTKNYNKTLFDLLDSFNFIVLVFYPQDNTPGCSIQIKKYSDLKTEFLKYNTLVLGVSMDSKESHEKFCESKNMDIELVSDEDGNISEAYNVLNRKGFFRFTKVSRNTILISKDVDGTPAILSYSKDVSVFQDANNHLNKIKDILNIKK